MSTHALVSAWQPVERRGEAGKERALQLLDRSDPYARVAAEPHLVASAVVMSSAGVLLHLHKLSRNWVGPGGHVDEGETPFDAVLREVQEETGIAARHPDTGPRLLHVDCHSTPKCHSHVDLRFLLLADPVEPNPPADESQEVSWFSPQEALEKTDESYRAAVEAALHQDVSGLGG